MKKVIHFADHKVMPWKNGMGTTREIFKVEDERGTVIRFSSAVVSCDGPFSDFSGYDRTLVNLGRGVMRLRRQGQVLAELRSDDVFHFDGALPIDCEVSEPLTDFNVFCRVGSVFASTFVRPLRKPEFVPLPAASGLLIYVINGIMVVQDQARQEVALAAGDSLVRAAGDQTPADRWMLAAASDEECRYIAVSFRADLNSEI